jgi:NADPH2:quinone reductase
MRCAFRIAASGINPGTSRNARIHLGWGCPIPALSRTATVRGWLTRSGDGGHPNGRSTSVVLRRTIPSAGTAAEFTVVPLHHVAPSPDSVSPEEGGCLGIPGITVPRRRCRVKLRAVR